MRNKRWVIWIQILSRSPIQVKARYVLGLLIDPMSTIVSELKFDVYNGLRAEIVQWVQLLLVKIDLADRTCGFRWPKEYKVS
ncbi:hypothetical protein CCR75_008991 [Bremia lactucae]|uniref:Uncharacterized protein n=1 Tax=Bremia lactucae TaxID=4779 RepID=A0A976FKG5_BRELC|nr:hypothetical protein CCR75_008991 [Bremia lactucae]